MAPSTSYPSPQQAGRPGVWRSPSETLLTGGAPPFLGARRNSNASVTVGLFPRSRRGSDASESGRATPPARSIKSIFSRDQVPLELKDLFPLVEMVLQPVIHEISRQYHKGEIRVTFVVPSMSDLGNLNWERYISEEPISPRDLEQQGIQVMDPSSVEVSSSSIMLAKWIPPSKPSGSPLRSLLFSSKSPESTIQLFLDQPSLNMSVSDRKDYYLVRLIEQVCAVYAHYRQNQVPNDLPNRDRTLEFLEFERASQVRNAVLSLFDDKTLNTVSLYPQKLWKDPELYCLYLKTEKEPGSVQRDFLLSLLDDLLEDVSPKVALDQMFVKLLELPVEQRSLCFEYAALAFRTPQLAEQLHIVTKSCPYESLRLDRAPSDALQQVFWLIFFHFPSLLESCAALNKDLFTVAGRDLPTIPINDPLARSVFSLVYLKNGHEDGTNCVPFEAYDEMFARISAIDPDIQAGMRSRFKTLFRSLVETNELLAPLRISLNYPTTTIEFFSLYYQLSNGEKKHLAYYFPNPMTEEEKRLFCDLICLLSLPDAEQKSLGWLQRYKIFLSLHAKDVTILENLRENIAFMNEKFPNTGLIQLLPNIRPQENIREEG